MNRNYLLLKKKEGETTLIDVWVDQGEPLPKYLQSPSARFLNDLTKDLEEGFWTWNGRLDRSGQLRGNFSEVTEAQVEEHKKALRAVEEGE